MHAGSEHLQRGLEPRFVLVDELVLPDLLDMAEAPEHSSQTSIMILQHSNKFVKRKRVGNANAALGHAADSVV